MENYKTTILGYQASIDAQEFDPRSDRLTKEGIEGDLRNHLRMIYNLLPRRGGKKSKSRRIRRSKKRSKKQSKRRSKRRRRRSRRAIKRWSQ